MIDVNDIWNKFGFKMPLEGSNFVVNYFDDDGITELTFIYDPRSDLMSDENYKEKHPVIGKIEVRKVFAHEKYEWQLMEIELKKEDVNAFDTVDSSLLEMPFEWEITLANGLWWKMDKQIHDHEFEIPDYLKVDPKNIILLEE